MTHPGLNVAHDALRVLAARIIVGDRDPVGPTLGRRAHQRPLAGIAIATAAKHAPQAPATVFAQGAQRLLKAWGVCA